MSSSVFYLFEANCAFMVLFSIFQFFFSRLTFYSTNRFFLLSMLPLAFILPALNFSLNVEYIRDIAVPELMELPPLTDSLQEEPTAAGAFDAVDFLKTVYVIGLLTCVFRLVLNAFKIFLLKRKSEAEYDNGFYLITADVPSIFSFFNWIFIPSNNAVEYEPPVIEHEKIHARKLHSLDLILTELLVALIWFNPFVYFFRRTIRTVHECQVDSIVLSGNVKKSDYLQLLLNNLNLGSSSADFYNYFNGLTIKKRVQMITQNKSSRLQLLRYFIIVPVLALFTMSFTGTSSTGEKPSLFPIDKSLSYRLTSNFGVKFKNPITKEVKVHKGIDIAAKRGVPVLATAGGTAVKVLYKKGYGNFVIIDHGNGYESLYAHLKDFSIKKGQKVDKGQEIGHLGNTGMSTGPHLHFEIRLNGENVNPFDYFEK